eukprot:UN08501
MLSEANGTRCRFESIAEGTRLKNKISQSKHFFVLLSIEALFFKTKFFPTTVISTKSFLKTLI